MIDLSNRIEDNLESKKLNTNLEKTLDTNTNSEIIGTNEKEFYTNSHSENIIFDENQKSINLINPNTNLDTTTSLSNILSDSEQDADVSSTDIDITADFSGEKSDADDERSEIVDMITEDAPEKSVEKTLEQLLETMTPLREDLSDEMLNDSDVEIPDDALDTPDAMPDDELLSDSDATLEQLANEFAENQDKIPEPDKPETHSKIGKLKNILPFKKVKRDDTGLMGDLFGWAGVAANDDDFSMPGFFTKTASKK